jgi:hypothetical protein
MAAEEKAKNNRDQMRGFAEIEHQKKSLKRDRF